MLEEPLWRIQEVSRDEEVLRLAIVNFLDGIAVEAKQNRAGVTQDNRRVGRDKELGVPRSREVVDDLEERELTLWRERCLGFIQNVDSLLEPIGKERNERLSVRLRVQRPAAICP